MADPTITLSFDDHSGTLSASWTLSPDDAVDVRKFFVARTQGRPPAGVTVPPLSDDAAFRAWAQGIVDALSVQIKNKRMQDQVAAIVVQPVTFNTVI